MPTLLYAPGVKVAISTMSNGIIDVSDDLVAGVLTLTENQPSGFQFQVANHRRKYDRVFTPNDRIIVQMRRIGPYLQTFSGYLNQVPYFSVYPRTVKLAATCTLKRLKFHLWDAGAQESFALLARTMGTDNSLISDNSIKTKVVDLLTKVVEWPEEKIHIGMLPPDWFTRISDLYAKLGDRINVSRLVLGDSATIGGQTVPGTGMGGPTPVGTLTGQQVWDLIRSEGATVEEALFLTAVAWPESNYRTDVVNGIGATGLWQIHPGDDAYLDPRANAKVALHKLRTQGEKAWTARPGGEEEQPGKFAEGMKFAVAARDAEASSAKGLVSAATTGAIAGSVSSPPAVTDGKVTSAEGIRFVNAENLKPNVYAAKLFVEKNWPEMVGQIGGFSTSGHATNSDHYSGLALDLAVSSGAAQGREKSLGNSMALWFASNPHVFGTKYVIWQGEMLDSRSPSAGWFAEKDHYDHVHVSFSDTGQTSMGPMGISPGEQPWVQAPPEHFVGGFIDGTNVAVGGTGTDSNGLSPPRSPLNVYNFTGEPSMESTTLAGARALMNDDPILDMVSTLMGTSMRSFMAAPNGDFIGWFPDYFGVYGTAGKMEIQDIELEDFTMVWDDERLVTHQFVAGSMVGGGDGLSLSGPVDEMQKYMTAGIVSIEFPEVMEALLNIKGQGAFSDAKKILQRFGARKSYEAMGTIAGPEAEFWYAAYLFQRNWAEQFSTNVPLTFMPEVFPGMILQFLGFQVQCYVTQVTHSFSFQEGGGFRTDATVIAPSTTEPGGGIYGLPVAL